MYKFTSKLAFFVLFAMFSASSMAGQQELLFEQAFDAGSFTLLPSSYNPNYQEQTGSYSLDFETADNFSIDEGAKINKVVFYGLFFIPIGKSYTPMEPEETEPFWIRFYEHQDLPAKPRYPTPDFENPDSEQYIWVDIEHTGDYHNENIPVYRLTARLPVGISMENGWFSAQYDSENGSGGPDDMFYFVSSPDGDEFCVTRREVEGPEAKSSVEGSGTEQLLLSPYSAKNADYDYFTSNYDVAFSLYHASDEIVQVPLNSRAIYITLLLIISFLLFKGYFARKLAGLRR